MITYSSDTKLTFKDLRDTAELAEKYFGTEKDPEQMPTHKEASLWILEQIPECVNVIKDDGKQVGFTFIIPCNEEIMDKFLNREINERQLYEEVRKKKINSKNFTTIYLCSAFVIPEYRRKGLVGNAVMKSIKKIVKTKHIPTLFYDAYSEDGKNVVEVSAKKLKIKVLERK